ncbi:hypothetical protein BX666DRAFT_1961483 [Dichotomocladium elegans]|nr:hypothetical protein BX666DRAFT_1961483 [Dichotomocladium elegans]
MSELGRRAEKLHALNGKFIDSFIHSLSEKTLSESFPSHYKHDKEAMHNAHDQITDFVREHFGNEFDRVKTKRDLVGKLNKLEEMSLRVGDAQGPRHVPQPDQVVRALRVQLKMKELERLQTEEAKIREENEELMRQVADKTRKLEEGSRNLEMDFMQPQQTMQIINSIPTGELDEIFEDLL